jgi:hypothetical protein
MHADHPRVLLLLGLLALAAALYFVWKMASDRRKRAAAVPSRRSGARTGPVWMTESGRIRSLSTDWSGDDPQR